MSNIEKGTGYLDMELLRFTTAGSVDDGKSTLIGRLLYDSKSIFEDQLEAVEAASERLGNAEVNLALLTDGLRAEREQGITIDPQTGLFSLLGLFAKVFVVDDIIDSINLCKSFTIITTKPAAITDVILKDIKHSATILSAYGAYTQEGKTVIMTVCRRSEAIRLRKKVYEIDPGAFMIITKTSEIMGKGFRDNTN